MKSNTFLRFWSIFAVRGIILFVIFLESLLAFAAAAVFWLVERVQAQGMLDVLPSFGGLFHAWVIGVLLAAFSFLLSIRLTQSMLHYTVTLNEWGMSGVVSANWLVGASEFVFFCQPLKDHLTGVAVLILAVVMDVVVCVLLQSQDTSEYRAAQSILPYNIPLEERERLTRSTVDMLAPVRSLLENVEFAPGMEHVALQVLLRIPAQCPFERDIRLGNRVLFHIPPLCKLNPLYDEFVAVRFKALLYLESIGRDISEFI